MPEGQKIPEAKLEAAKHSGDPAEEKRANYAINIGGAAHHKAVAAHIAHTKTHGNLHGH